MPAQQDPKHHDGASAPDDVDAAVAALYAGPPDEFVTGRDALVRTLRAAKRRDEASAVKSLRKPKAVARALNAANLHDPDAVADLVAAAGALGDAQAERGDVRAALDQLRAAETAVADAAVAATSDDRSVDAATVTAAVRAVLADPDALATLRAGRLVDVPTGGGFGTFGLGGAAPSGPAQADTGATPTERTRARAPASTREPAAAETSGPGRTGSARPASTSATPARGAAATDRREPRAVTTARQAVAEAEEVLRAASRAVDEIAPSVAEAEEAEQAARDEAEAAARAADEARERALESARRATAARREAATLARRRDQAGAKLDKARARLAKAEGT